MNRNTYTDAHIILKEEERWMRKEYLVEAF